MSKLEDIPKKHIFSVPEDYFEKLPFRIQSRIPESPPETRMRPAFRYALQLALPAVLVAVVLFWYTRPSSDATTILATVGTDELIYYLQESGLTTEDLMEYVEFDHSDVEAIESEVYDLELPGLNDDEIDLELNAL